MATPKYSITTTTIVGSDGKPDLKQTYGVLLSDGTTIGWPATLTTITISNSPVTSISATIVSIPGENTTVTTTLALGQLHSGEVTAPWPATLTGTAVGITLNPAVSTPITSTPSSIFSASSTSTSSIISQTTSTGPKSRNSTSRVPTSTSGSSRPVSSPSSGISTGAIAGIAIGCALAGLAIGLLVAFCLSRRQGKRNNRDNLVLHHEPDTCPSEKRPLVNDIQLSQFMLEATPDRTIAEETQSIGSLIDQHVDSYYHVHPVKADTRGLASVLADLGLASTTNSACLDAQAVTTLCLDPRTRRNGLRHVIMRVLFNSIDMHSFHGPSMLPAPVASFLRTIPPAGNDRYGDSQANALALHKWRKLSAFLLHPARSQRTSLPAGDAAVATQARELASSLNSFLRVFIDHQQQHEQQEHLQAVIEECAKLGYMLFSHPSDWGFVYEAGTARGVVVEAGLCKLGARDGGPQPAPNRVLEPVVVSSRSSRYK